MIGDSCMAKSLARFRLMPRFPGADRDVLAALAGELSEICATDAELDRLTAEVTHTPEFWPGVFTLRQIVSAWRRTKKSSDGVDPFAIWVPPWEEKECLMLTK